eukprot:TRINITY_DN3527_c0_g1_i1.p1 TRINITY_DN3527_c0_g1~~TRINITY_DN3527_c0_g1_i1.p1  ORF type:complete len:762 (+),score=60.27 TRINITY_DN3527_c0_g1_i1:87-2288(+)
MASCSAALNSRIRVDNRGPGDDKEPSPPSNMIGREKDSAERAPQMDLGSSIFRKPSIVSESCDYEHLKWNTLNSPSPNPNIVWPYPSPSAIDPALGISGNIHHIILESPGQIPNTQSSSSLYSSPLFQPNSSSSQTQSWGKWAPRGDDTTVATNIWVDALLKEVAAQSAPNVPMSQLIQNIQQIVSHGDPQVAALLEYRLRTLEHESDDVQNALGMDTCNNTRGGHKRTFDDDSCSETASHHQQQNPDSALKLYFDSSSSVSASPTALYSQNQWPSKPTNYNIWSQQQQVQEEHRPRKQPALYLNRKSADQQPESVAGNGDHNSSSNKEEASREALLQAKTCGNSSRNDEEGLHLLGLLLQCAEAVSTDNLDEASSILSQITELSTPYGTSLQRVAAYFAEAMSARVVNSCLGLYSPIPQMPASHSQKIVTAFQVFNGISPLVKFSHFTANQAIQEALEREKRVHIIDLDIMQGLQWPGLFHILASRPGGAPHVRITGIGTSLDALEATGKRLSDFARTLNLPFEFNAVAEKVGNIDIEKLKSPNCEAVAVHWLHHSLYDVSGSDAKTLRLLEKLNPRVITIVEQELSHEGSFLSRFVEALHYYSALFDSLGATYPQDSEERHVVEQQLLAREIKNILAVGGPSRTGELRFRNWKEQLKEAGFKPVSLSGNAATQASLLLGMLPCHGYSLVDDNGALKLGWKDLCLLTASAWTPSSSHSQPQPSIHSHYPLLY